jgi:hypothetical protein
VENHQPVAATAALSGAAGDTKRELLLPHFDEFDMVKTRRKIRSKTRRKVVPVATPIGWREWVGLPDFGIERIKAKIDTGALTSALHAARIRRFAVDGVEKIRFDVHPLQRTAHPNIRCEATLVDERAVRSSDGASELRPVIEMQLQIGDAAWPIEVTLTNRELMGFRLLLGRRAVRGRFLVNPGRSWLLSKR